MWLEISQNRIKSSVSLHWKLKHHQSAPLIICQWKDGTTYRTPPSLKMGPMLPWMLLLHWTPLYYFIGSGNETIIVMISQDYHKSTALQAAGRRVFCLFSVRPKSQTQRRFSLIACVFSLSSSSLLLRPRRRTMSSEAMRWCTSTPTYPPTSGT